MKRKDRASESYYNYGYQDQAEDRLSLLPDALLISILSYIDTKLAVQCSFLSKRSVNLWTLIPVLNLDVFSFGGDTDKFNIFIDKVLAGRDGLIKVDSVNSKVACYPEVARVFDYALLQGVRNVSIETSGCSEYYTFPCNKSSDLLISLSLKGVLTFNKFLNFNGLVSLRLERVGIMNYEPFSSFPNLENLKLVYCWLSSDEGLEVIGTQLSRLTISTKPCERVPYEKLVLLTPKLVLFELKGLLPMSIKAFELLVLDTAHIDSFTTILAHRRRQKLSLITVLRGLRHAINIHLSPSTVKLLSRSHKMLVKENFQFDNLKVLNLIPPTNKQPAADVYSSVASDLLKDCPQAVVKSLMRL